MNATFRGLKINIENPAGSVRSGVDPHGKPWSVKMTHDYGEIVGSKGIDGDPVDVFIGPNKSSNFVFIIHQLNRLTGEWDEDKCFLGFSDMFAAKKAYYKNFDNADLFYGDIETIPFDVFKKKIKTHDGSTLIHAKQDVSKGDPVTVDGMRGRGVVVDVDGKNVVIKYRNGIYIKRNKMFVHHMGDNMYKSAYVSAYGTSEGVTKSWDTRGRGKHESPFKSGSGTEKLFKHLSDGHWVSKDFLEQKNGEKLAERIARINYHGKTGGWKIQEGPNNTLRLKMKKEVSDSSKPKQEKTKLEPSKQETTGSVNQSTKDALTKMCTQAFGGELTPKIKVGIDMMAQRDMDSRLVAGLKGLKVGSLGIAASGLYEEKGHKNTITLAPSAGPSTFVHEFGHHIDYQWLKDVDTKKSSPLLTEEAGKLREAAHTEFWNEKQKVFGGSAPEHSGGWMKTYNMHIDAVSNYALQNNREWFAENWRAYFHHPETFEKIKDKFPNTYQLIDGLAKGKFFK